MEKVSPVQEREGHVSDRMPVAVAGCGRMGRLHARVYSEMPQVRLAGVVDADKDVAKAVAEQYDSRPYTSVEEMLADNPDLVAATIAVPTVFHLQVAEPLMRRGVSCLIEKPLAKDESEARQLTAIARETGVTVQVGHIERFNPAVRAMARLGVKPRFIEVTRISPMTFRSIDVGVVLDMMIHDIDIVLRLADSPVKRIDATGVSLIGNVEDICNARITFANGCVANVTASRLAMKTERRLRVFSHEAYVSIDYQKRYGIVARRSENLEAIRTAVARIRAGEIKDLTQLKYDEIVQIEELKIDDIEPLRAEAESFISAVKNKTTPEVTVDHGLAAVEVATRIVESIQHDAL